MDHLRSTPDDRATSHADLRVRRSTWGANITIALMVGAFPATIIWAYTTIGTH